MYFSVLMFQRTKRKIFLTKLWMWRKLEDDWGIWKLNFQICADNSNAKQYHLTKTFHLSSIFHWKGTLFEAVSEKKICRLFTKIQDKTRAPLIENPELFKKNRINMPPISDEVRCSHWLWHACLQITEFFYFRTECPNAESYKPVPLENRKKTLMYKISVVFLCSLTSSLIIEMNFISSFMLTVQTLPDEPLVWFQL